MKTYFDQVGKILLTDKNSFSWIRNSDWFTAITDLGFPEGGNPVVYEKDNMKMSFDPNSFPGKAIIFEETRMQKKFLMLKKFMSLLLIHFCGRLNT